MKQESLLTGRRKSYYRQPPRLSPTECSDLNSYVSQDSIRDGLPLWREAKIAPETPESQNEAKKLCTLCSIVTYEEPRDVAEFI